MKFILRLVLSLSFAAAVAGSALAQRPGGGGAGGGFGMGGGFGGGSAYRLVATNKVLQDELKVTDEQKKKVEEAMKPITEKQRELFSGGGFGQNATDEQRKEMREKMEKISEETKKAVEGVLDDKQKTRLSEINVQVLGFGAFSNKDVQEKLKLTDAQKEKVKTVAETYQKDSAELRKDMPRVGGRGQGGNNQPSEEDAKKLADYRKKADALKSEAEDKVKAELTADQKTTWKTLVGEKFDTTKLTQFGGGQGGQRPGGNRQRPNN
ncbi:Spy/CpxP family protein refolding chaperone [Limnoglobus roseus]|uniref:Serine/threonine protein kinase n=1 Tax=Limnoglobus roseus TaxID=2598579 RepID=A0A5C1AHP3_9BACT|nr:Spy/CpxP family protein refolding chaperone [Limnoglobus roseus]QEL17172.1 serine/threonine protein kinase [Limnoglobus roseus]